ncbi:hypothetical protein MNV49_001695 [Pseudohyphozyma bogoriensis]|nr:hypothetical protein MNV49_001695 [Pseudohyphozyma bogoriensis]
MSQTQTQTQSLESATASLSLRGSTVPLKSTGVLDKYSHFDNTPVIGRQFDDLQLVDLLNAPNSDELIKELAVIVSQRNVVFFKNQSITADEQKILGQKLGELSGKPASSTLHVHPVTEEASELGDEVTVISSEKFGGKGSRDPAKSRLASTSWHSDITFEPVPSDFAILKIFNAPETGGDTLWASAYEAYDRLTPAYQKFLEGLHAYHEGRFFINVAKKYGSELRDIPRGSPENVGPALEAVHPVIRTNPVTGWKGVFVNPGFTRHIVELNKDESDQVLQYLFKIFNQNHDLQVRFKWSKNDVAIWTNASSLHSATFDYAGTRTGQRVVSIGEKPYFDPNGKSRREALGLEPW